MNEAAPDHDSQGRRLHVLPLVVIAVLAVALWRPAAEMTPSQEEESKMKDLAALLGSPSASADDIDNRLRSFGPFPPVPNASRALADALITCGTAALDESERARLARQLHAITVVGDDRAESIPAALLGMQQMITSTGCSPATIDELLSAARAVASTDPNPRRDWW